MSDERNFGGFTRPKFYAEVNNTLTASTDVITQFGTVRNLLGTKRRLST